MTEENLTAWQRRLESHFGELRTRRSSEAGTKPLFALEHGLTPEEISQLQTDLRSHISTKAPSSAHALPWIAYAAELGYRYVGDEYWQTFEHEIPGWSQNGKREWVREQFVRFGQRYGGVKPGGAWAEHFSIICWPITHAILPQDLQRQLARILFDLRHHFTGELLEDSRNLGMRIAERSWDTTSRFQNLAQDPLLLGQIAAALLLDTKRGQVGLILPETLRRIGNDLDRERMARTWLHRARDSAKVRAQFIGLAVPRSSFGAGEEASDSIRNQVAALGIEPRALLRPRSSEEGGWDVLLEFPSFGHIIARFPSFQHALASSRCTVAGSSGSPRARGWLVNNPQRVRLDAWPQADELLLSFENAPSELTYLLKAEAMLRPGPTWLFRIASDGLAYEVRGLNVRTGQRYVVLTADEAMASEAGDQEIKVNCKGVRALQLTAPSTLTPEWQTTLTRLGLNQPKNIEVQPAGLAAAYWDGEGHSEWLATDAPCFGVRSNHALSVLNIHLEGTEREGLACTNLAAGEEVLVQFPPLPIGLHNINVTAKSEGLPDHELGGQLAVVVREPRSWQGGLMPGGVVSAEIGPPRPSLEEIWDGSAQCAFHGPRGRFVVCEAKFYAQGRQSPIFSKRLPPLSLPVSSLAWSEHFKKHLRELDDAASAYDRSQRCDLHFNFGELGMFALNCRREFTPLRWAVERSSKGWAIVPLDDSGSQGNARIGRYSFETPDVEEVLDTIPSPVDRTGGLFVADHGIHSAAVVVPPILVGVDLSSLQVNPRFPDLARSPSRAKDLLARINLWASARTTGTLLSVYRRHEIVRALTRHLFFILGGEMWGRSESAFSNRQISIEQLQYAVSKKREESELAIRLRLASRDMAKMTCEERARQFAASAIRTLRLPSDASGLSSEWVCNLILRLASDPASAMKWAGEMIAPALAWVYTIPVLARAARFLVLSVDDVSQARQAIGRELYAGWTWA